MLMVTGYTGVAIIWKPLFFGEEKLSFPDFLSDHTWVQLIEDNNIWSAGTIIIPDKDISVCYSVFAYGIPFCLSKAQNCPEFLPVTGY